jgi:hypothetical protein
MELRKTHFPYCIQRLEDGRYIILNRNYKPLGNTTGEWIDYATDASVVKLNITTATAKKLSWEESQNIEKIFLYNDGCIPTSSSAHMNAYLKRLSVLMKIKQR